MDISINTTTNQIVTADFLGKNYRVGEWQNCLNAQGEVKEEFKQFVDAFNLEVTKDKKKDELNNYYFYSNEIRVLSISNHLKISLTKEGRDLISEQIKNLEEKLSLNQIQESEAIFRYYYNGGYIDINLQQIRGLYIGMMNIVNSNFKIYRDKTKEIIALASVEEVENYNLKEGFLINQNIDLNV